jgi:ubiquinone/menaquinone biosynthesis C-methylase UbiE
VDYSATNVERATRAAHHEALAERVEFVQGDAEQLGNLADGSFDAVLCECAYCTFPNKPGAAKEIARVLAPGGCFGLSDLTREGALPAELDGLVAWLACIADAQPRGSYVADLEAVGLRVSHIEMHDEALAALIDQVRGRLLAAEVMAKLQQLELPGGVDLEAAKRVGRAAAEAVKAGLLGYALIVATRSARARA